MRAPRALPGGRLDAHDDQLIPARALTFGLPHSSPSPRLRLERQPCRLTLREVGSLLLLQKPKRLDTGEPSHLLQPLDGNQSGQRLALSFDDELIVPRAPGGFAVHPEGRRITYTRSNDQIDVWTMDRLSSSMTTSR
jgi:hypothetical protein